MGFLVLLFVILLVFGIMSLSKIKGIVPTREIIFAAVYVLSFGLFVLGMMLHDQEYTHAIDPIDVCYIPFGGRHIISLFVYFLLYHIAVLFIWIKGRKLPPLTLVLMLVFLMLGMVINLFVLAQVIFHDTTSIDMYKGNDGTFLFIATPLLSLVIGISLLLKIIKAEHTAARDRVFKNAFLQRCNSYLAKKFDETTWALILLLPVFIVITLILVLFGQDYNSLVKVFTDTTTWTFSQKMHPPVLEHRGHYLCTVAAKGHPRIVKPLKIGHRHGHPIIVNRQLQIANAFEELIQDISPRGHRFIRHNYDKYGYNLSLKINTERASNITYLLMRPLEWFFLVTLYLFCVQPEVKIKKQYH
ncbi:DUF6688 domain-containing protein [Chitinophaga arvensicola]|uniref:Uncharacterized protein n=1 Tax=Chitinophaga arvensicola TaxID=29529 RepID=A0A1I0SA41_9BACT|nr:DUF6688 family protein [Chitinophaga arvensicola]SEW53156.1 hypothetical protein SAMN04488122_5355 [Chitinophaga arvensicola]